MIGDGSKAGDFNAKTPREKRKGREGQAKASGLFRAFQ
jgi:hypothetical protein